MVAGISGTVTIQEILWVLGVVSLLLTLRAILSQTWVTMWLAALVSLASCLVAIWSFGSLLFLFTCVQLAAALAMRRSSSPREWVVLLLAGVATFGLVVFGLAFLRLWDAWMVAFPLAFILWSMPLRPRHVAAPQPPFTPAAP